MVDFVEALKRPFSDIKKLIIYIVVSIIPIVNLIGIGYLLDVAHTAMRRRNDLPDFKDLGKLFVEGIIALVIGLIYAIPILIIIGVMFAMGLIGSGLLSAGFGILGFAALGGWMVLTAIVGLAVAYIGTGGLMRYVETRKLGEAFNFNQITKKVFTKDYFIGWLVGIVIVFVLNAVLGLIPMIGSMLATGIGGIFYMSVLGEIYSKA